jgi:hypothetical protein
MRTCGETKKLGEGRAPRLNLGNPNFTTNGPYQAITCYVSVASVCVSSSAEVCTSTATSACCARYAVGRLGPVRQASRLGHNTNRTTANLCAAHDLTLWLVDCKSTLHGLWCKGPPKLNLEDAVIEPSRAVGDPCGLSPHVLLSPSPPCGSSAVQRVG